MVQFHFKNFRLLEPSHGELRGGYELLLENECVRELSERPIKSRAAEVIHSQVNIRLLEAMPLALLTATLLLTASANVLGQRRYRRRLAGASL
jgi:hypothetical protein